MSQYNKKSWYYIADLYREFNNIKREINLELFVSHYVIFLPGNKLLIVATSDHTAATTASYLFTTKLDTSVLTGPMIALNTRGILGPFQSTDGLKKQFSDYMSPGKGRYFGQPTNKLSSANIALQVTKQEETKVYNPNTDEYEYGDKFSLHCIETGIEYEPVHSSDVIELTPFIPAVFNLPESCLQDITDYTRTDKPAAVAAATAVKRTVKRTVKERKADPNKGELVAACKGGNIYSSEMERRFVVYVDRPTDTTVKELKALGFSYLTDRGVFRHSLKLSGQRAVRAAVKVLGGVKD